MSDIKFGIILPYFSSEKVTDFITSLLKQDYKDFYVVIVGFNDEMLSIFEGLDSRFLFLKLDFLESNLDSSDLDSMFNLYAKAQNAGIDFFKLGLESNASNTAGGGGQDLNIIESNLQDLQDSKDLIDSNNSKNSNIYTFKLSNFTIYTKNKTLNIPKIDYIYFADSAICLREDFLSSIAKIIESKQTLESSILTGTQNIESNLQDSKENTTQNLYSKNHNKMPLEIIYFKIFNHFKNVETKDFMDSLLYNVEHEVSGFNVITRALTEEISDFSFSYDILINFKFLIAKNISFMENTLHYMKLFSALIIAQSNRIYILPQNLVTQIMPKNTLEKLTDSITKNAKNKEFIAQSYLKMALTLSEFCKDSIESNPQDFKDSKNNIESNPQDSKDSKNNIESSPKAKQNFLDSILKQNLNTLFTHFYYIKALDLLDCNPSKKTIKTLENLSKKLQNLKLLGAYNAVKNSLEYQLGSLILSVKTKRIKINPKRALKLPFNIIKMIKNYKIRYKNITQIPLETYADSYKGYKLCNTTPYMLGVKALQYYNQGVKFAFLPFTIAKILNKSKEQKPQITQKVTEYGINEIILHKKDSKKPKLILTLGDIGVGDYLGFRPLLESIREYYKDYEITFFGSFRYKEISLAFDKDYIDIFTYCNLDSTNVWTFDKDIMTRDINKFFSTKSYDILIYCHDNTMTFIYRMARFINAREKISAYSFTAFCTKCMREELRKIYHRIIFQGESDIFVIRQAKDYFEKIFNKPLPTPSINLRLDSKRFDKINFDFTQKYAVIFPGTTNKDRMYDIYSYKIAAKHLHAKYNMKTFIVGSEYEKPIAEKIANPHIINICGKYTLDEIAYILNKSALVLCNNSGGYHLSMCVCDNIIALSSGGDWTRFVNYPPEFKAGKLVSTPLPRDVFSNPYYEYNFNNALLNSISPSDIITLIDTIHSKRF